MLLFIYGVGVFLTLVVCFGLYFDLKIEHGVNVLILPWVWPWLLIRFTVRVVNYLWYHTDSDFIEELRGIL